MRPNSLAISYKKLTVAIEGNNMSLGVGLLLLRAGRLKFGIIASMASVLPDPCDRSRDR